MSDLLATVHIPPRTTVPIALICMTCIAWYWLRLGNPDISRRRRSIRRVSMAAMFICVVLVTLGMSFVDGDARPSPLPYVVTWIGAFISLLILIAIAIIDSINSVHETRQGQVDQLIELTARMYRESGDDPAGNNRS